ncbi:MAG: formate dehydrogenase accessory protein FdhE [Terriglobia bacterium]
MTSCLMPIKYTWDCRIQRAENLAKPETPSGKILMFYIEILKWQHDAFKRLAEASRNRPLTGSFEVDHPLFLDHFDSLLELARRKGSQALIAQAEDLIVENAGWKEKLAGYWNGEMNSDQDLFARAALQPYLELLATSQILPFDSNLLIANATDQTAITEEPQPHRMCPFCGRKPQVAFLSNDTSMPGLLEGSAEGGRRFLMCGDCLTLWPFLRIACVSCSEQDPHKLPYYQAEELPYVRVDCCDACKCYIKTIDLTKDNRAVPPVDELAAIPLDLWAQDHGYTKIHPNLAGM